MSNLHPLKWTQRDLNPLAELELTAYSALHDYEITEPKQGKFELKKTRLSKPDKKSEFLPYFDTVTEAQDWAWAHYQRSMQPYVNPDSITDIANWFKAAKPEPTDKDKTTQLGCIFEEVAELAESIGFHGTAKELEGIANELKGFTEKYASKFVKEIDNIAALDATSDITVTVQGFNQIMGFDGLGAQREVIRSNNSKMVKGKFQYDENGKMKKGESYSAPDLTPFVKQGE